MKCHNTRRGAAVKVIAISFGVILATSLLYLLQLSHLYNHREITMMNIQVHDNKGIATHKLSAADITPQVERKLKALYAFGGFCKVGNQKYPSAESLLADCAPRMAS
ncbi:hypothetical protein BFC18_12340 [Alteromonas confluentis]|uniref:Uncharacterized protein n=2 Tax=Alteromonas confluentis TaxID=1656094 RepID=A0A1E7ZAT6_9ALTE|nr:hypothetical protein BFC18_12340 [Alteromonas confluentis]